MNKIGRRLDVVEQETGGGEQVFVVLSTMDEDRDEALSRLSESPGAHDTVVFVFKGVPQRPVRPVEGEPPPMAG